MLHFSLATFFFTIAAAALKLNFNLTLFLLHICAQQFNWSVLKSINICSGNPFNFFVWKIFGTSYISNVHIYRYEKRSNVFLIIICKLAASSEINVLYTIKQLFSIRVFHVWFDLIWLRWEREREREYLKSDWKSALYFSLVVGFTCNVRRAFSFVN